MNYRIIKYTCILLSLTPFIFSFQANARGLKLEKEIYELNQKIITVKLMEQMLAVDVRIKRTEPCASFYRKKEKAVLEMKKLNADYGLNQAIYNRKFSYQESLFKKYTEKYKQCFSEHYQSVVKYYPRVKALGSLTYNEFDRKYKEIKAPYYGNERIAYFSLELQKLNKKLNDLKSKDKDHIGIIRGLFGKAYVKEKGISDWKPVKVGYILHMNDHLRTGPRGRVRWEYLDHYETINAGPTVITISKNSVVVMEKFDVIYRGPKTITSGVIDLLRGGLRAFTKGWGGRAAFSVRTGTSLCGIRGTDIEIKYSPAEGRTHYRLYSGVVDITTPSDKLTLKHGYEVTVVNGVIGDMKRIQKAPPI